MKRIIILGFALGFLVTCGCSLFEDEQQDSAPVKEETDQLSQDSATAIYRQFFFSGTHNSYSGNLDGMKREGIKTQLERGLRFFEFDLFSYHTQNIVQKEWPEEVDESIVFDYQEKTHLLTYTTADGVLKIYKLGGDLELVYDNTADPLPVGARSMAVLPFQGSYYLLNYHVNTERLTTYSFTGTSLSTIGSETIEAGNATVSPFSYKNKAYLAIHNREDATYRIHALSLTESAAPLGEELYTLTSLPSGETLSPFVQGEQLYLFRHNVNSVTNFKVETIDTQAAAWSATATASGTSDLLKGTVQVSNAGGNLYVNAYTASGSVTGAQLVMDNDIPNLVSEYNNEADMLAGAEARVYPGAEGYYLFLRKGADVQLSRIVIGELVLGHDAPGDEVDLNVDNPSSIFLADWIAYMANWSEGHPNHEPLFIMTELKNYEQWVAGAKWQEIILLMQENFGEKLRYHSSSGFENEAIVDQHKIVDGETRYFMDESGDETEGLLGKVILYIQPNNNITKSDNTNNFEPFEATEGKLQANFLQLKRYRENNKLVSPDWRKPGNYGNDIGDFIDQKDNSYISRIFHMQSSAGDGQYDNIRCTNVMFAVSDRPFDRGLYGNYVNEQKIKNKLEIVAGCE